MKTLGNQVLGKICEPHGMQKVVAEATGISQTWLSRLSNESLPGRENARMLSERIGIDLAWWERPIVSEDELASLLSSLPWLQKNTGT